MEESQNIILTDKSQNKKSTYFMILFIEESRICKVIYGIRKLHGYREREAGWRDYKVANGQVDGYVQYLAYVII